QCRARPVDVDFFIEADPASAAFVARVQLHPHWPRQFESSHGDHVNGLIGTKAISRFERGAIEDDQWLEAQQRIEIADFPRAHDIAPVGDLDSRGRLPSTFMEVCGEEIEARRLESELWIGDAALANENDLFPSA